MEVFLAHDVDGNGVLDQTEFVRCISELGARLGIDCQVAVEIFRSVDANGDGMVAWKEFVLPAVAIVHAAIVEAVEEEAQEEARRQATEAVLNGMTQAELEDVLRTTFEEIDTDGSGKIDTKELRTALVKSGIPCDDTELNFLLYNLDINYDGRLDFQEFVLLAFEKLVDAVMHVRQFAPEAVEEQLITEEAQLITEEEQIIAEEGQLAGGEEGGMISEALPVTEEGEQVEEAITEALAEEVADAMGISMEELAAALEEVFVAHDVDDSGTLDQSEFVRCMAELGQRLGIGKQVASEIFRAVDVNGDGRIDWREFVQPAVTIIHASIADAVAEEIEAEEIEVEAEAKLEMRRRAEEVVLEGTTQAELEDILRGNFETVDTDASGKIDLKELWEVLSKSYGLRTSPAELNYLLYTLDTDEDGKLSVEEFLPISFDMLINAVMDVRTWDM